MAEKMVTALLLTLASALPSAADPFDELTDHMSVARHANVIVATSASPEAAAAHARRISAYDVEIRKRHFPSLAERHIRFIVGDDPSELSKLEGAPAAGTPAATTDPFGYYRRDDSVIVASTAAGYGAVLRELVRAHLGADNPNAPHWFEIAMASLYESSAGEGAELTPIVDDRMSRIAADEDLDYDVFAGICDCYAVTGQQLALMRLLLMHLHERGQLASLYEAIERKGQYVTLIESLDAMDFDREAWKRYAERSVKAFWKSREEAS